ncbi:hypothetical protein LP419_12705 [Massilia sp. H-1]|nr:hypothetical protein LP419_12705 [Massilia sp. H-1]
MPRYAMLTCHGADLLRQFGVEFLARFHHAGAAALHIEQAEWRGRLGDVAQLLAEVGFVLGVRHGPDLGDEVTVRQSRRQRLAAA